MRSVRNRVNNRFARFKSLSTIVGGGLEWFGKALRQLRTYTYSSGALGVGEGVVNSISVYFNYTTIALPSLSTAVKYLYGVIYNNVYNEPINNAVGVWFNYSPPGTIPPSYTLATPVGNEYFNTYSETGTLTLSVSFSYA
jgi:hypothetical protein